jgi:hypothetical protein
MMFLEEYVANIKKVYDNITNDSEFEVMFYNYNKNPLSYSNFLNIYDHVKSNQPQKKTVQLDIIYDPNTRDNTDSKNTTAENYTYRISINNIDDINSIISCVYKRPKSLIISDIIKNFSDKIEIIKKIKPRNDNIFDINDYDIRIRHSKEVKLTDEEMNKLSNIPAEHNNRIIFRYKNRLSVPVSTLYASDKEIKSNVGSINNITLDLTIVKQYDSLENINGFNAYKKSFEIEIDYSGGVNDINIFNTIIRMTELVKIFVEGVATIISNKEKEKIIQTYKSLLNEYNLNNLYSMQPIAVETKAKLSEYTITEKTDGSKIQLLIIDNTVYIIDNNLQVMKTNVVSKLNKTIYEGEILIDKLTKKTLIMIYDCLYYDNNNVRNNNLYTRFSYIYYFLDEFYGSRGDKTKKLSYYNDNQIKVKSNGELIKNFYANLNDLNKNYSGDYVFHQKIFFYDNILDNYKLISDYFINNKDNINCPYSTDGVILTHKEQKYTKYTKEQKHPMYKFKPSETNSIDLYVTYEISPDTGDYLEIYDTINMDPSSRFRCLNFFVGDNNGNKEYPVPFLKEEDNNKAYFPIIDGHVRDKNNDIIADNTVIEVIYRKDLENIPHFYRWEILRTRKDKTDMVINYGIKYGNFKNVAIGVWETIKSNNTLADYYNNTIMSGGGEVYYQKKSDLIINLRKFHSWVKSILIENYCRDKVNVLDIGCGRGGDIYKWAKAKVENYIGVDSDYNGLFGGYDSATSRYRNIYKKQAPQFDNTNMHFGLLDARCAITVDKQLDIFGSTLQEKNRNLIERIAETRFDIISYQFSIHYLFENKTSVNNLINLHKNNLKIGGYTICTLIDPTKLLELFNNNEDTFSSYYVDESNGEKILLFKIKKYHKKYENTYGQKIDFHMKWISNDDIYLTEYAVTYEYLIQVMNDAGCVLIESDSFGSIYDNNKKWFTENINHENDVKKAHYYNTIANFFKDTTSQNRESKKWNNLFRYYVFEKIK